MNHLKVNHDRITVAQIVSGMGSGGGVERVSYELALHLDPCRYRVVVCCLYNRGELGESLAEQGIPIFVFNGRSSINPLFLLQNLNTIRQLKDLLCREGVQIAHTHEFFSGTLGRVAARLANVPVTVLMVHNKDRWKGATHILVDRVLAHWTDVIVANSHSVKEFTTQYEGLSAEKFAVIHNGIDVGRFIPNQKKRLATRTELGLKPDTPTLAIVGRLTMQKGHHYLIEALSAIRAQFPDLRLLIVGDDNPFDVSTKEAIFRRVENLKLTENVIFLGQRQDVPDILNATDIFVLPSLWEGFGLAIAEAMAAGKPVVATKVDGIPEVVENGVTGILVPSKSPEAVADAIIYLLNNREKAEVMGKLGRERVQRFFAIDKMVGKWDELYQSLIHKKMAEPES